MKVGDVVSYNIPVGGGFGRVVLAPNDRDKGVVVEIMTVTHAKQWPKVKVLTGGGLEEWIVQHCEVINESG